MAGAERQATAQWRGDLMSGSGTVHLDSSNAAPALPVTWAARTQSSGGKTSPEELIAAAHAACYCMALSHGLAGAGNAPEQLDVRATSSFEKTDAGFRLTTMRLEIRGRVPGIDGAAFKEAAENARTGCPVSNALSNSVKIEVDATLEA
jgi:osmotically inducible protein OsmC